MAAPPVGQSPAPAPAATSQMPSFMASLGRAELFMAAGAALIVLSDLLFVIFGPYGFSTVAWAAAIVALILIFLNARMFSFSRGTYESLLVILGAFALLIGIRELLSDVQFLSGASVATTYFLGMLSFYAGVVLMALGGWFVWQRRAK
jgi:hypothetical protein